MKLSMVWAPLLALACGLMLAPVPASAECGIASYYTSGALTANGERYDPGGISAAHKTLPFGTRVIVRNQKTGRSILVRINDRGPFVGGRIIDLSRGARNALGMGGLAPVCLEVVSYGNGRTVHARRGFKAEARALIAKAHKAGRIAVGLPVVRGVHRAAKDIVALPGRILRGLTAGRRRRRARHYAHRHHTRRHVMRRQRARRHYQARRSRRTCWHCY